MSTPSDAKKPKTTPILQTHSGTFHADESLAIFLLKQLPRYSQAELVRSRNPQDWAKATVVVDVGGEYSFDQLKFDHHQRGFQEVFGHGFKTKLSSAGLIYKHFGKEVISEIIKQDIDSQVVETLWLKMYQDFVEAFDGIDNGITQYVSSEPPLYRSRTDISSRISALNPRWNEDFNDEILDQKFLKASELAGREFLEKLDYLEKAWLPAREIVKRAVENRKQIDQSGKILLFKEFAPWKEHLHILEKDLSIPSEELPLYVLYPEDSTKPDESKYRIQAVSITPESFESRKPLPEQWRGVRDRELSKLTGIQGCIFVHAAGFIGGNASKAGALEMARKALEM